MENNKHYDQLGKDTNVDAKQKLEEMNKGINKSDFDPSKNNSKTNNEIENDSKNSITRKEHDDTGHEHEYKTPGDEKKNQSNTENKSNDKSSTEQNTNNKNETINKGENQQNNL